MPRTKTSTSLLPESFFHRDSVLCARELIGTVLAHGPCRGIVLETEAYREHGDPASHLFTRPSVRKFAHEATPGTAYVHRSYGIHWLMNVLCRDEATGDHGFVLFRALEPIAGLELMAERRQLSNPRHFCDGPGKLTMALGIEGSFHARSLIKKADFSLSAGSDPSLEIISDMRIGISTGKDLEWRFLAKDHPGVSVKASK